MECWSVEVDNKSFDGVNITKDCQDAVCEYIWNGFEANATSVQVVLDGKEFEESPILCISDNGTGIDYNTIKSTFGAFLSSVKRVKSIRIKSQTNKGKGRYSFFALSTEASWDTTYKDTDGLKQYTIRLDSINKVNVQVGEIAPVSTEQQSTGTVVKMPILTAKVKEQIAFSNIRNKLLEEFAWYLYLNRASNTELVYYGNKLDYKEYINEELSRTLTVKIENEEFLLDIVVWKNRINNSSKIYYLNEKGELEGSENTTFNKNSADFHHGVFVRAKYFSDHPLLLSADDESFVEFSEGQKKIMRELKKHIKKLLDETFHDFLVIRADAYIKRMEEQDYFPAFSDDDFGKCRKMDFIKVTRELYCVEPKIFKGLKDQQAKTMFNFVALLLDSNERENVLSVMEQIVELTAEQRTKLAQVLRRTKLSHVIDLVDVIQKRLEVIKELKSIMYDPDVARFSNERDHVQRIVEQHYWLFGDQYSLVSADITIKKSLNQYEELLQLPKEKGSVLSENELRQRMDVVLYGSRMTETDVKEGIVVELKAPSVVLDQTVFSQIERYANIVRKEPRFSGANRCWRFFAVCSSVDEDIKAKYEGYKQHGKWCLAGMTGNFEIYALSWDDVFLNFEKRYRFLLKNIKDDFDELTPDDSDSSINRDYVNNKVEQLLAAN